MNTHPKKITAYFLSIIISIFIALFLLPSSCEPSVEEMKKKEKEQGIKTYNDKFSVFIIDSCEYIVYGEYQKSGICHKGNCKFCKERNK